MGINFNKAEFILSAVQPGAFLRDGRPQVAFAGRSNVGKSSVINRLLNRKNFCPRRRYSRQNHAGQLLSYRRKDLFHRPARLWLCKGL